MIGYFVYEVEVYFTITISCLPMTMSKDVALEKIIQSDKLYSLKHFGAV